MEVVSPNARACFASAAVSLTSPDVLRIEGWFTLYGFEATASVIINDQASRQNCTYAEHWVGSMVGAANTIPGG